MQKLEDIGVGMFFPSSNRIGQSLNPELCPHFEHKEVQPLATHHAFFSAHSQATRDLHKCPIEILREGNT